MKRLFYLFIPALIISLSSCSNYTQVVYVSPVSSDIHKVDDKFYEYENSDVKVRYSFWAEHGIMGFMVYNKTDHPLYIDWKKSNMIDGDRQRPYYTNKTVSNFSAYGQSYGTSWVSVFSRFGVSGSNSYTTGTQTVVKQERVTFVSPHSYVFNAFYNLTNNIHFDIHNRETHQVEEDGNKMYLSRPKDDILFRNYITYADNEDFTTEKHLDNEFKVIKVFTMKNQYFNQLDQNNREYCDWEKPTRFYITNLKSEEINQ